MPDCKVEWGAPSQTGILRGARPENHQSLSELKVRCRERLAMHSMIERQVGFGFGQGCERGLSGFYGFDGRECIDDGLGRDGFSMRIEALFRQFNGQAGFVCRRTYSSAQRVPVEKA